MSTSIDFSTFRHYIVVQKRLIKKDRLVTTLADFDTNGVTVVCVKKEALVAGFQQHKISTRYFKRREDHDHFFLVAPVPFNIMTPATKNSPNGVYHSSSYGMHQEEI
ncbi:unnamed protein product [Clonostachys rosea]|uniref:Uncharacterized protein n=1 Tax=Bionectria ochroleuca TaxID=29856 RepID=A0ABY6TSJ1_BIOOC|nr:unnamed protein product [Clonostachys rosea]